MKATASACLPYVHLHGNSTNCNRNSPTEGQNPPPPSTSLSARWIAEEYLLLCLPFCFISQSHLNYFVRVRGWMRNVLEEREREGWCIYEYATYSIVAKFTASVCLIKRCEVQFKLVNRPAMSCPCGWSILPGPGSHSYPAEHFTIFDRLIFCELRKTWVIIICDPLSQRLSAQAD